MKRKPQRPPLSPAAERYVQRAKLEAERIAGSNREQAEERLEVDRGLRVERAQLAYDALGQKNRLKRSTVGIVALRDSNPQSFLQGIDEIAKKDNGRVITFPASSHGRTSISHIMEQMTQLQLSDHESGLKVVVFNEANYQDREAGASAEVTEIISKLAVAHTLLSDEYHSLGLMVVGEGRLSNVMGSTQYDITSQPPFADYLSIMFALDKHNELNSAPESGIPTRIATMKPFEPVNAVRSNYPATTEQPRLF